jgi:hypothetical protein
MEKKKIEKFITWIKQPSSIKAIVMFAGLAGATLNPDKVQEIITGAVILYGGIAAFVDKN